MPKGFYAAQRLHDNAMPDDGEAEEARIAAWQQHCLERSDGSTLAMILNQEFPSGEMMRFPQEFADINRTVKLLAEHLCLQGAQNGDFPGFSNYWRPFIDRLFALTESIADSYSKVEGALAAEQTPEWPPLINLWRNK